MSTQISTSLLPDTTVTNFRAWVQFIHDLFSLAGMVQTADTGQISSIAALAAPTTSNQSVGYEIWRFDDTLQSSAPIFIKIEYGSGPSTTSAGLWLTIGQGSNGSGTITGVLSARTLYASAASNTSASFISFGSGAGGSRMALSLFLRVDGTISPSHQMLIGIERSKDSTGADTGEGIILISHCANGAVANLNFLPFSGLIPATDGSYRTLHPITVTSSAIGGDVHMYPIFTFNIIPKNPALNFMLCFLNDYVPLTVATSVSFYGANHSYMPLVVPMTGTVTAPLNSALRPAMRYE